VPADVRLTEAAKAPVHKRVVHLLMADSFRKERTLGGAGCQWPLFAAVRG
jgi:hypothetical protein